MFKIISKNKTNKNLQSVINLLNITNNKYELEINPLIEFQVINISTGELFYSIEKLTECLEKDSNSNKNILHD